jgi:hypothetical protein
MDIGKHYIRNPVRGDIALQRFLWRRHWIADAEVQSGLPAVRLLRTQSLRGVYFFLDNYI